MSIRFKPAVVCLCALTAFGAAPRVEAGPVTLLTQQRRLVVGADALFEAPDSDDNVFDGDVQSDEAEDLGLFEADLTAEAMPLPPEVGSRSDGTHRSELSESGIGVYGFWGGATFYDDAEYRFDSTLNVTFRVDEAREYTLAYQIERPDQNDQGESTVSLRRIDGGGETIVGGPLVFDPQSPLDPKNRISEFSQRGVLAPGEYELDFRHAVENDIEFGGSYVLNLEMESAATAIPLPPAVWAGLSTLGGLGLVGRARGAARRI